MSIKNFPHLPVPASAIMALFSILAYQHASAESNFDKDAIIISSHSQGPLCLDGYQSIHFECIEYYDNGAALSDYDSCENYIRANGYVSFNNNSSYYVVTPHITLGKPFARGGVICSNGAGCSLEISLNSEVDFNHNVAASDVDLLNSEYDVVSAQGGVIYNEVHDSLDVIGNVKVGFSFNEASAAAGGSSMCGVSIATGGAIVNEGVLHFENNGEIGIWQNFASVWSNTSTGFSMGGVSCMDYIAGGAISNAAGGIFEMSNNGDIGISSNIVRDHSTAPREDCGIEAFGGAILNEGDFSIAQNQNIFFLYNEADIQLTNRGTKDTYEDDVRVKGGAIYNTGSLDLIENQNVLFQENQIKVSVSQSHDEATEASFFFVVGGAICNADNLRISGNQDVSFLENVCEGVAEPDASCVGSSFGGAIANNSYLALENNRNVLFEGNKSVSMGQLYAGISGPWAYGGAIVNNYDDYEQSVRFDIIKNANVIFRDNAAQSSNTEGKEWVSANPMSGGGAICAWNVFNMNQNGDIEFSGNTAQSSGLGDDGCAWAEGGALYCSGTMSICQNGDIRFMGNAADCSHRLIREMDFSLQMTLGWGGAICNMGGVLSLSENRDVSFVGNVAKSESRAISLCDQHASAQGGAIGNSGGGEIFLCGNGNVTFSANVASATADRTSWAVVSGGAVDNSGTFTLSGNGDVLFEKNVEIKNGLFRLRSIASSGTLNLSASDGKSILFRDSVYADGTVSLNEEGRGAIIITGATTEDDLRVMKNGISGTAEEIALSRQSSLLTDVRLAGGLLSVQDKAELTVNALSTQAAATLEVKDAAFKLASGNVSIASADGAESARLRGVSLHDTSLGGADAGHTGAISGAAMDICNAATLSLQYLTLDATTQFRSPTTALSMTEVTSQMVRGMNSSLAGEDTILSDSVLVRSGREHEMLTMAAGSAVLQMEGSTFDAAVLQGETLHLILSGYNVEELKAREYLVFSFINSTGCAEMDKDLAVSLEVAGIDGPLVIQGWYLASEVQNGGRATALYFDTSKLPEPATATFSLLALAALAARRRR